MLDISLIGTGGMMPLPNRYLTSSLVRINGKMTLIDCGEGTQVSLKMLGWGYKAIDTICFTHFHADHISGLPGLLLTIGNAGKQTPLTIVGPVGLKRVVDSLRVICPELPFQIIYCEIESDDVNAPVNMGEYVLNTLSVEHRIACLAYSIEVPRRGKFLTEKAKLNNVPQKIWSVLQKNDFAEYEGIKYSSDMVLGEDRKGLKICYCTDCRPSIRISEFVKQADLFICEGMYGEEDKQTKAKEYKHMTYSEAAALAQNGEVKELWLTHFSPSMAYPAEFAQTAKDIFPNTVVAYDRITKTLAFEN